MKTRNKKNIIIMVLCFTLVFIGIGYSLLKASLTINSISNSTGVWDLEMEVNFKSKSDNVTYTEPIVNIDKKSATINNTFKQVDDFITYTITIKNNGNINAKLEDLSLDGDTTYFEVINTFAATTILPNESASFDITLKVKSFDKIPTESLVHTISFVAKQQASSTPIDDNSKYHNLTISNDNLTTSEIQNLLNMFYFDIYNTENDFSLKYELTYKNEDNDTIIISIIDDTTFGESVIELKYKNDIYRVASDSVIHTNTYMNAAGYSFYDQSNVWTKPTGDITGNYNCLVSDGVYYDCETITVRHYTVVSNFPIFNGEWTIDEENSSELGKQYLSNLLFESNGEENQKLKKYKFTLKENPVVNLSNMPSSSFSFAMVNRTPSEGETDYQIDDFIFRWDVEYSYFSVQYSGAKLGPDNEYYSFFGNHTSAVESSYSFDTNTWTGIDSMISWFDNNEYNNRTYWILVDDSWNIRNLTNEEYTTLSYFFDIESSNIED